MELFSWINSYGNDMFHDPIIVSINMSFKKKCCCLCVMEVLYGKVMVFPVNRYTEQWLQKEKLE
jgi:hypothetical protein